MKFGDNIKKIRKYKKLSQEDLAEKMQVSRQSVSKWENGDAYPEMNNILQLCKIFHCSITDLVNDNLIDANLLDEDVKSGVIKLKKEQQVKMKALSKCISTFSKIGKVFSIICFSFVLVFMIILGLVINKIDVINNQIVYNNSDNVLKVEEKSDNLSISIFNLKALSIDSAEEIDKVKEILSSNSKLINIGYVETALVFIATSFVFIYILLNLLEKLFNNIHNGDTPFTLENVGYVKKLSYIMIVLAILPNIINAILDDLLKINMSSNYPVFSIIQILFMFCISYIFQYGYALQLDSKGKMYE